LGSLFVAKEGKNGTVYQARGDAIDMHYQHGEYTNIFESQSFHSHYTLNPDLTEVQMHKIVEAVDSVPQLYRSEPRLEARFVARWWYGALVNRFLASRASRGLTVTMVPKFEFCTRIVIWTLLPAPEA
jgi:hypothetical protein